MIYYKYQREEMRMGELTDANVRNIIRSELGSLAGEVKRDIAKLEGRIHDLQAMQADVQRTLRDVEQLMSQTKSVTNLTGALSQMQLAIEEIRVRAKRSEETSRYTAGYVAMRLKERYDKNY